MYLDLLPRGHRIRHPAHNCDGMVYAPFTVSIEPRDYHLELAALGTRRQGALSGLVWTGRLDCKREEKDRSHASSYQTRQRYFIVYICTQPDP